jgi:cell division protein FtsB
MDRKPPSPRARRRDAITAAGRPGASLLDERPKLPPRRQTGPWLRRALIFVICALVLGGVFGDRGFAETLKARRAFADAAAALSRMKIENAALAERARRLKEDPSAIEAVARQDLGLARRGEILVTIHDLDTTRAR